MEHYGGEGAMRASYAWLKTGRPGESRKSRTGATKNVHCQYMESVGAVLCHASMRMRTICCFYFGGRVDCDENICGGSAAGGKRIESSASACSVCGGSGSSSG